MLPNRQFSPCRWVAGSLFSLALANCLLIVLVAGTDIVLGQPPQLVTPLFGLVIASSAFAISRRRRPLAETSSTVDAREAVAADSLRSGRQTGTPAYVAMTIIRRRAAFSAPEVDWEGTAARPDGVLK
jgi:hypothetical protein